MLRSAYANQLRANLMVPPPNERRHLSNGNRIEGSGLGVRSLGTSLKERASRLLDPFRNAFKAIFVKAKSLFLIGGTASSVADGNAPIYNPPIYNEQASM